MPSRYEARAMACVCTHSARKLINEELATKRRRQNIQLCMWVDASSVLVET